MTSKRFICSGPAVAFLAVVLFCAFNPLAATSLAQETKKPDNRPNIVFIMADDLGWGELGCYGQQKIPTPNIDALASGGMRFTAHYSGAPVCAPSRCVLMTGKHLGNASVRGNRPAFKSFPKMREGQHPIPATEVTLATLLQKAGYKTGAFGKWGLGPVGSSGDPNKQGFDTFYGYNCQRVAHSYFPPHLWHNNKKEIINKNPIPGHQPRKKKQGDVKLEDYQGEVYAPTKIIAQAEKFIRDNKDGPFFLYVPVIEPHVAMHPLPESVNRFPKEWDPQQYLGDSGYLPHPRPHAGYAAMINDVDRYVGRIMKTLKEEGVDKNTIIVFTSDNGTTHKSGKKPFNIGGCDSDFFNSTRDLRGFKGSVYEGGIRVPMIVHFPGTVPAGKVDQTPSYFADWLPTLCSVAGAEVPAAGIDGENLWPMMTGKSKLDRKKPMVWAFAGYGGQVAIRMGDFKAVRRNLNRRKQGEWELYNLKTDRSEKHNIAGKHPEIVQKAVATAKAEIKANKLFPVKIHHEE